MEKDLDLEGLEADYYLIGQITAFSNRFQAVADKLFVDISWKQCFALICIKMLGAPPTINELSSMLGSSHQNVKQLLLKLKKTGYIEFAEDEGDRRKLRIILTDKAVLFDKEYAEASDEFMNSIFDNINSQKLKAAIETLAKIDKNLKDMEMQTQISS